MKACELELSKWGVLLGVALFLYSGQAMAQTCLRAYPFLILASADPPEERDGATFSHDSKLNIREPQMRFIPLTH